jgi:hypothetical protein
LAKLQNTFELAKKADKENMPLRILFRNLEEFHCLLRELLQ